MKTVALVSCGKGKKAHRSPAGEIYTSTLFKASREYAKHHADEWYILSAKHGLVSPEVEIDPYEETLKNKSKSDREAWSEAVAVELFQMYAGNAKVIILGGVEYVTFLKGLLTARGFSVETPLEGMSLGKRTQFLLADNRKWAHFDYVDRFYDLFGILSGGLSGGRLIKDCDGKCSWPTRGVYFFTEPGELRGNSECARIVRVGTHAVSANSKSTLWNRLSTHRGTAQGLGSHRSSIFRLHVGTAIMRREGLCVPTWSQGQSASRDIVEREIDLERAVSEHIGGMTVHWLNIPDAAGPDSDRAYIERNFIGLLSPHCRAADMPSANWLGNFSVNEVIRCSGLWNLNHVGEAFDPKALDVLEAYVFATIGEGALPKRPLAPRGWRFSRRQGNEAQLSLF